MLVEVITDPRRLRELEPEWNLLAEQCAGVTPFQLPAWLITWWSHFGSGELHVLAYRKNGVLVALLPFFFHTWEGRRQVTLVGSGISDYLEPMILPEHKEVIIDHLGDHLQRQPDWEVCIWQDLNRNTPLARLGEASEETPCSAIQLKGSFDEYWAARGPNLRRNVARYGKRAEASGRLEFEISTSADDALFDELVRQHAARWAKHGEPGMVAANGSDLFLRRVACAFARKDMLRIFTLRYRGGIAAIILSFLHHRRIYGYLTGFDPAYEEFGPGRLLLFHALRHCFEQGYCAWDFLRGEEPYKAQWGAEQTHKSRVVLLRSDARSNSP
ncbi:MAG TPA: GNAT family N-acetyltransferase [Bryobacteraceae bacterium]|jgi:CelD/BcsL family acetyltransferase involved in cellulose biosynthesis|nr:GNAT family N-acetyltransferase [Bryobacteraceae bacterium]